MRLLLLGILVGLAATQCVAVAKDTEGAEVPTGSIRGMAVDAETKAPLTGVSVHVPSANTGAITGGTGDYRVQNLPVGTYTISFHSVGYQRLTHTDVVVRSGRSTQINAALAPATVEVDDIIVSAGFFAQPEDLPTSTTSFSHEEIRRAPGSAGDVSRIMQALPSIAKIDDQLNSLVVRGGSPSENGFYLDNIEIPNINHFPLQGTSGGPIGLLHTDFLHGVEFSAGGFPASYGDRLSSVMELEYREGNREEFDAQIDMNMAGAGIVVEGPIGSEQASWMFAGRRSYLDMLVDAIGTGVAPRYGDYQGKLVWDISRGSQLSMLGIYGYDAIEFERDQSIEDGNVVYGSHSGAEYAFGFNWQHRWGRNGYSNTSLGWLGTRYEEEFFETDVDTLPDTALLSQNTLESAVQLRNVNHYRLTDRTLVEFGLDVKQILDDYDYRTAAYTNSIGGFIAPDTVTESLSATKFGGFGQVTYRFAGCLTTTLGGRYDYFEYVKRAHASPRFSFSLDLSPRTALNGAFGLYRQFLPMSLVAQDPKFRELEDPRAYHYILGLSHLLRQDTKLTIEAYFKDYDNFPMDRTQPQLFLADEVGMGRMVGIFDDLESSGEAWAAGLEVILQKKLVDGVYGLISGAFFRTRYKGLDGQWRDRIFDNRCLFTLEGGYKSNERWEFSLRWIYAGGRPYSPLDPDQSAFWNRSVRDLNRINGERVPAYHSLNLRMDRRFHFDHSNLVVYISIWNAYNRKNVSNYYWNQIDAREDVMYQWSLLPIGGLEWEF